MQVEVKGKTIELVKGDITRFSADALVNAAGPTLKMGGGVAGAILRKGGRSIQDECDKIGYCPTGEAVVTGAGRLKARYVIHAVGPRYGAKDADKKLMRATLRSLELAEELGLNSIVFPAISTGIFGFPKDECARIMLSTVLSFARKHDRPKKIIFCLYDDETFNIFKETLNSAIKALNNQNRVALEGGKKNE